MPSRFDRHELIPGWKQDRLAGATVVIAGMGALGNEASRLLAMVGVGRLIVCDPDRVAVSNLSRTVLFRERDIGSYKVEAAAVALAELVPGVVVEARPAKLVQGVGLAELRDAALVLGCLDSRAARLQLAGRCSLVRAPLLDGGTHPWGGEVRPYLDPDGPCYACGLTTEERATADVPWSCLDIRPQDPVGASAPTSAVVGAWLALVASRFLMGLPGPGGTLSIDGSRGTTRIVQQERDPECPFHRLLEPVSKVAVSNRDTLADLRTVLPAGSVPLVWEPVQQRVECPACGFEEARCGTPRVETCPRCGMSLRPRTTLELGEAPGQLTLAELGIAPREILPVRGIDGTQGIELAQG
jgi:molybdopterin/thiamine biosynthesis adenylyltransferase